MKIANRFCAGLVAGAMLLSLAACGGNDNSASTDTAAAGSSVSASVFSAPGTYTAAAAGINGDVKLTVTVSADAITNIAVESSETPTIGAAAMDQLKQSVLENQTIAVDAVAGATISSNAFLTALKDCIEQAGGDLNALSGEATAAGQDYSVTNADVIVVGAGGAGLMAAMAASDEGASVILLEKSGYVGGNTLCATMGINAAGSAVQNAAQNPATVEDLIEIQSNNEDARPELVQAYAENSGEAIDYLSGLGVEFTVQEDKGGNTEGHASGAGSVMLMAEADGKTSTTIINALNKAVEASDVNLYLNTDVTSLITDDAGTVVGVKATADNGSEIEFTGKSIILATGGFGQNQTLLSEMRPDLANAITDERAPTTGEGLLMAQALGAETVDLDAIQLFPHVINGYGLLTPMNIPGGFKPDAIYVNENAQRFTVEGFEVSDAILAQPEGMAYCIFNESNLNDTLRSLVDTGFVVSGDTVEELAEKLGLDADALQATIDQWNADCAAGADTQFGRDFNRNPLDGTLYAYNFGVGAHYFMGGILIDADTHVMNTDGQPINGLFAAGEVTGGFHGTTRVDGSGTGDAIVFGRISGKAAAASAKN